MRNIGLVLVALVALGSAVFFLTRSPMTPIVGQLSAVAAASGDEDLRWRRVTTARPFAFPEDHGPHPGYQTEWWYYTGNLKAANGDEFGFQLTFFRRGLDPEPAERSSAWATSNIYLAHFTVSDLAREEFFAAERFSRDGAELAGAQGAPFRVWLGAWQVTGNGPEGMSMRLQAQAEEMAIDLQLVSTKPPTLQGELGYSVKGQGQGNASYYYSLTRMSTTGTLTTNGRDFEIVGGSGWMDHEWGTSQLEAEAVGWDWFALQLSDGSEITWAQIRQADGSPLPASFGTVTAADGTTSRLGADDLLLDVTERWKSPRSGGTYPAGWRIRVPTAKLDLEVTPRLADQELPVSIVYWEGSVGIRGYVGGPQGSSTPITGVGYVELTGYAPSSDRARGR